jgi:hypothetical protein
MYYPLHNCVYQGISTLVIVRMYMLCACVYGRPEPSIASRYCLSHEITSPLYMYIGLSNQFNPIFHTISIAFSNFIFHKRIPISINRVEKESSGHQLKLEIICRICQYFSLTKNQRAVLSAMTFQPSKQVSSLIIAAVCICVLNKIDLKLLL